MPRVHLLPSVHDLGEAVYAQRSDYGGGTGTWCARAKLALTTTRGPRSRFQRLESAELDRGGLSL
jgi:hypothetical protein